MPRFSSDLSNISRAASLVVAASNAPAYFRAQVDYVCDGVADEVEINAAIVAAAALGAAGSPGADVLLLPGDYALAASINMSSPRIALRGVGGRSTNTCSLNGTALTSSAVVRIAGDSCLIQGLDIRAARDGIDVDGTSSNGVNAVTIRDCQIHNNTRYGVWFHNGAWNISIIDCSILNNTTAGIYSVSPNSGEQNGNAMSLVNTNVVGSGSHRGLVWNAASLNVTGCSFEGGAVGIEAGGNSTNQPTGVSIVGNYFEPGYSIAAIRIGDDGTGIAGNPSPNTIGCSGVFVAGNYMAGSALQTDMIVLSQMTSGIIGMNAYISTNLITGAIIRSSSVAESCWIFFPPGNAPVASSFGSARVTGSASSRAVLIGQNQVGVPWSESSDRSGNLVGTTDVAYWYLSQLRPNDFLQSVSVRLLTDGAGNSTNVNLQRILVANSGGSWANVTAPETFTGDGTFTHTMTARVSDDYAYRIVVTVTANVGGTYYYIYNPRLTLYAV